MIRNIFAGVVVDDLAVAGEWYARMFGRKADAEPMDGLLEWHFNGGSIMQIVQLATVREIQKAPDWGTAGASSVVLVVDDLDEQMRIVEADDTAAGMQFTTPKFKTATVRDPSGNIVTFLQYIAEA